MEDCKAHTCMMSSGKWPNGVDVITLGMWSKNRCLVSRECVRNAKKPCALCSKCMAVVFRSSFEQTNVVLVEASIPCDQRQSFVHRLRDEQPVERVVVVMGEVLNRERVLCRDVQ